MALTDLLKSKKLPIGVFAGAQKGPQPAKIYITMDYDEYFSKLVGIKGFTVKTFNSGDKVVGTVAFEIPVTPPTVKLDFGSSNESSDVVQVGEVVLPKYQKAIQIRWESFFPYDTSAPYLSTNSRNLSWGSLSRMGSEFKNIFVTQNNYPEVYINIFKHLAKTKQPISLSMTFYEGGNLPSIKMTLDTFQCDPESNGDYNYSISFVEWTDLTPKRLNSKGETEPSESKIVKDKQKSKIIQNISKFFDFCKKQYPIISNKLLWAFASYNGIRNFIFDSSLKIWKIKGSLQDLGGRFGILNNILGKSKITSSDTQAISQSLKKLSYTKASQQLADLLKQNMPS